MGITSPKSVLIFFVNSIMEENKASSFQNILLDNIIDMSINISLFNTLKALNTNSDLIDNKEALPLMTLK